MSWRTRRQFSILLLLAFLAALVLAVVFLPSVLKAPSCSDGKRNGDERGVDCGGSCSRYCPSDIAVPEVAWARAFLTKDGVYNLVAYVENRNVDAATASIPYEFRVYDADNILITRVEGTAAIMPNGPAAIFEGGVALGESIPKRVSFAFLGDGAWTKIPPAGIARLNVVSSSTKMSDATTNPKLETTIVNQTTFETGPVDVVAILFDEDGNAFGVSKTFVENLPPRGEERVFMSWPQAFTMAPTTISVITAPNVFTLPPR